MIPRVYLQFYESQNEITITDDDAHYLLNVLRKKQGDEIKIFNENVGEFSAVIQHAKKNQIILEKKDLLIHARKSKPLYLIFAVLKNDAMSWVFEKATELGVTDFFPIYTEYSQKQVFKKDKWYKVIKNAVQQCERLDMPQIHPISTLNQMFQIHNNCEIYVALERQNQKEKGELKKQETLNKRIQVLIVGPEGGWSSDEREIIKNSNAHLIDFGPYILRAETAIIAGLSLISLSKTI